jgi:hypothetical protein
VPTWNTLVTNNCGPVFLRPAQPRAASLAAVRGHSAREPSTPNVARPPAAAVRQCDRPAARRTHRRSRVVTVSSKRADWRHSVRRNPCGSAPGRRRDGNIAITASRAAVNRSPSVADASQANRTAAMTSIRGTHRSEALSVNKGNRARGRNRETPWRNSETRAGGGPLRAEATWRNWDDDDGGRADMRVSCPWFFLVEKQSKEGGPLLRAR